MTVETSTDDEVVNLEHHEPELEVDLAEETERMVHDAMTKSARTIYSLDKKIGVSDIGGCREYVRRMLLGQEWTDDDGDAAAAFIGTAIGEMLEQEYVKLHAGSQAQLTVDVPLIMGEYRVTITGHPDIVDSERDILVDWKTKDGLAVVRKGPIRKNQYQITMYAKALIEQGLLTEGCTLALVYYDRSGGEPKPVVHAWKYDETILDEAQEWLADVIYAIEHDEEASRDMPRSWCESYCPYSTVCRGGANTDVEGFFEDEEIVRAVDTLIDARARESAAKKDKEAAAAVLKGLSGHTATATVRTTWIDPTVIAASERAGYHRLDVRKKRTPKS